MRAVCHGPFLHQHPTTFRDERQPAADNPGRTRSISARMEARSSMRALAYSYLAPCSLRMSPTRPPGGGAGGQAGVRRPRRAQRGSRRRRERRRPKPGGARLTNPARLAEDEEHLRHGGGAGVVIRLRSCGGEERQTRRAVIQALWEAAPSQGRAQVPATLTGSAAEPFSVPGIFAELCGRANARSGDGERMEGRKRDDTGQARKKEGEEGRAQQGQQAVDFSALRLPTAPVRSLSILAAL